MSTIGACIVIAGFRLFDARQSRLVHVTQWRDDSANETDSILHNRLGACDTSAGSASVPASFRSNARSKTMQVEPTSDFTPRSDALEVRLTHRLNFSSRERWSKLWLRIRRNWQLYALLFLPLVWLVVFRYAPMYGAQIAFRDYSPAFGIEGSPWVGLANFERFLQVAILLQACHCQYAHHQLLFACSPASPYRSLLALSVNQVKTCACFATVCR